MFQIFIGNFIFTDYSRSRQWKNIFSEPQSTSHKPDDSAVSPAVDILFQQSYFLKKISYFFNDYQDLIMI